ncbi:MAG: glutathione S-transferase family protein [Methylocella sp.]
MMKLYWAPRTRSLRALWGLEEAGVPYERVRLDLAAGDQKSAEFRAINPMAKVPALTDGTLAVAESGAICAYVAEAVPQAGLAPPLGDPARAPYLRWLFFSPGCVEQAFLAKFGNVQLRPEAAGFGEFDRVFDVVEAAVTTGPWLLGEKFSAADVMIGLDLYFGIDIFKLVPSRPALRAYVDRCLARPALQRAKAIEAAGS